MNTQEVSQKVIIEMFARVGLDYSWEQIKEYAQQEDWYRLQTWTVKEEASFVAWAREQLPTEWDKKTKRRELGMFLLNFGWKRSE